MKGSVKGVEGVAITKRVPPSYIIILVKGVEVADGRTNMVITIYRTASGGIITGNVKMP